MASDPVMRSLAYRHCSRRHVFYNTPEAKGGIVFYLLILFDSYATIESNILDTEIIEVAFAALG